MVYCRSCSTVVHKGKRKSHEVLPVSAAPSLNSQPPQPDRSSFASAFETVKCNDLSLGRELGAGSFGKVRSGIYVGTNVAVKFLHDNSHKAAQEFQKEVEINAAIPPHTNVVKVLAVATGEARGLVMELYQDSIEGYLQKVAKEKAAPITFEARIEMAINVCAGLMCLHAKGVVHRCVFLAVILCFLVVGG